jgi:hypothetical protein
MVDMVDPGCIFFFIRMYVETSNVTIK